MGVLFLFYYFIHISGIFLLVFPSHTHDVQFYGYLGLIAGYDMNAMKIPSKRGTLEKKLDKLILTLFCVLFSMCVLGAIGRLATVAEDLLYDITTFNLVVSSL